MHLIHIARSQQSLEHLYTLLDAKLDSRMYSAFHNTTASAPSLRAPVASAYTAMAQDDDPGNIKVVVRCRTFLKRGTKRKEKKIYGHENAVHMLQSQANMIRCRARQGHPVPDPHGPSHREDDAACA